MVVWVPEHQLESLTAAKAFGQCQAKSPDESDFVAGAVDPGTVISHRQVHTAVRGSTPPPPPPVILHRDRAPVMVNTGLPCLPLNHTPNARDDESRRQSRAAFLKVESSLAIFIHPESLFSSIL